MARQINSLPDLKDYFDKVVRRANHHAKGVNEIALAVMGGVVWKSNNFRVMEVDGDTKNVLWMESNSGTYYFTYDHEAVEIVVRKDNNKGQELIRFNNQSANADVKAFFEGM